MMVLQVELTSGATKRVCWIDRNLSVGEVVTLKGEDSLWEVTAVYSSIDIKRINRNWNNNI